MNELTIILGLVAHWIGDFVFQRSVDAENKSKSLEALTNHTSTYTAFMSLYVFVASWLGDYTFTGSLVIAILFGIITFATHTGTDYVTSRISKRFYIRRENKKFFMTIGFDQILHYVQLYYTLKLLYGI